MNVPSQDIIHARFPLTGNNGEPRKHFATPIIQAMRPALEIGLAGDEAIKKWLLAGGGISNLAITYGLNVTNEAAEQLRDKLVEKSKQGPSPACAGR